MNDIEKRFHSIKEVEPDVTDLKSIERIERADDTSLGISLDEMDAIKEAQEYSGKISLRLPRTLHKDLTQAAKKEGVSLNQFILFKLSK